MIYKYINPQRNLKFAMFYKCGILDPAPIHTCGEKVNYVMVSNKSLLIFKVFLVPFLDSPSHVIQNYEVS